MQNIEHQSAAAAGEDPINKAMSPTRGAMRPLLTSYKEGT